MSPLLTIALMGVVTYLSRYLGFALGHLELPDFWLRFLRFVPIAVFAALVAPELPGTSGEAPQRLLAAAMAAVAIWRFGQLWLGLAVGLLAFWVLRGLF
ncbi:branched-subunit amino acid transport protein [Deinobacterium chartae]|uniref:Branched-subunit amino acid transport protein n=1 Tax=Deinobacterium chartae TaxID=521158 RepID=A0A841I0G0_9DEIO|nr:AzlD domain-containing protein [Deinobacterium chartae]MBB6098683.1 branched-subunit amino acid transport protein [Deinobacterium chartae]